MFARVLWSLWVCSALTVTLAQTPATPPAPDQVLQRYLSYANNGHTGLRDFEQEITITGVIPELEKQGRLRGLRKVSKLGKVSYETQSVDGDNMVKKYVIANYMEADIKASDEPDPAMAINETNYKFRFERSQEVDGWLLYLFELEPRKRRAGMFEGWMWMESTSGLPVRESGRFVKNPSVYLKRVEFMRDYRLLDGVAVPMRIESTVNTRLLVGPANLEIDFGKVSAETMPRKFTAQTHLPAEGQ